MGIRPAAMMAGIAQACTLLLTLRGGLEATFTAASAAAWSGFFFSVWRSRRLRIPAFAAFATSVFYLVRLYVQGWPASIPGWVFCLAAMASTIFVCAYLSAIVWTGSDSGRRRAAAGVFVFALVGGIEVAYSIVGALEQAANGTFLFSFRLNSGRAVIDFLVRPILLLLNWAAWTLYFHAASRDPESQTGTILGLS